MKYPAELYRPSRLPYRGLEELDYPFHDRTVTVTHCGPICWGKRKIDLSRVFARQNVGLSQVSDKIWLVTFMHYQTWDSSITRHVGSNRSTTRSSR